MICKQRIKQDLLDVLALRVDFSGIEDDQKFEGPSTRSEEEKHIRACNFQLELVWELTESIAVFSRHLSSMVAEKSMNQCIKTAFH